MKISNIKFLKFLVIFFGFQFLAPCYGMEGAEEDKLNNKIGRLLIVGFKGTEPTDEEPTKIREMLKRKQLGGVILYGYNIIDPDQLSRLTQSFIEADKKVFIAVDQEGGRVQRLVKSKGFTETPSAQDIADANEDPEQAREHYRLMAKQLSTYNFNVNFGPIGDLNDLTRPSPAIGKYKRSYGNDPERVYQFAKIFIEEHHKKKICTAPKHFPGHGYSTMDSHEGITDTTHTANFEKESIPYKRLIESGYTDMIMTAHVVNRNYDEDMYPATLSSKVIPHLLRDKLNYKGVVISDDLLMGAIIKYYKLDTALILALNATCDLLIISNNSKEIDSSMISDAIIWNKDLSVAENLISIIRHKVESEEIKRDRILESYKRIKTLKKGLKDKI